MTFDSPYKGLVPFEDSELDALLFFGRGRESQIIAANVLAARLTGALTGRAGWARARSSARESAHRLRGEARENLEEGGHPEFAVVVFDCLERRPGKGPASGGARGAD